MCRRSLGIQHFWRGGAATMGNPSPDWLLKWVPLQPTFAITNPTWEEGPINPLHIFGPNMAVRADVFQSGYRFNTSVGPSAGSYAMGSETEFTNRLARSGF